MTIYKKPDGKIFATEAQQGEVEAFPDIDRGWGVTLDHTDGKPPLEWMNAAFKRTDEQTAYLRQQGVAPWEPELSYPADALTNFGGTLYLALKESRGKSPVESAEAWRALIDIANFADIQAGAEEKLVDAAGLLKAFPHNFAPKAGYFKLPNGLIIQWLRVHGVPFAGTIQLPIAFPNAGLTVFLSDIGNAARSNAVDFIDKATIQVWQRDVRDGGTALPINGHILAIGY